MKTKKRLGLFFVGIVAIFLMSISVATAQNKVVVIPLMEAAEAKLDPFAPVAAESPPNSSDTDNGDGTVTDLAIGLTWQQQDDNVTRNWVTPGITAPAMTRDYRGRAGAYPVLMS